MTDKARIRIAAAVTALFLAGIGLQAAGPAARDHRPQAAATARHGPGRRTPTPSQRATAGGPSRRPRRRRRGYDDEGYEEVEDDE